MKPHFVRTLLGVALVGLLAPSGVLARQTATVSGQVIDAGSGRALRGAQVFIEGREAAVVTDNDGRYTLTNVPVGEVTLRVRAIGYSTSGQTMTVRFGQEATADFGLTRSAISLDQLVVTGTGREVERRKLSTTLDVIDAEEIETAPVTSVDQLLQGRAAGATVSMTSAQAGTGALINFRGVSSVFGSQTPVIYVDGVRVDNNDRTASGTGGEQSSALSDLLVSDIERVEITKGGAASTLYGSDAATGVIQIFTKRGTPGAPKVTFRIEQGADVPELKYIFDAGLVFPDLVADDNEDPKFLENNFFQTGHFQNYALGVGGGSERTTYTLSGRVQQADGVQLRNENELYSLRGSVRNDIDDKWAADFSANYTRTRFGRLYNGTAIADPLTSFEVGDALFFTGADNLTDALDIFVLPDISETVNRFTITSGLTGVLSDMVSTRATLGLDYRANEQRQFQPIGFVVDEAGGQLQTFRREFLSVSLDVAGTLSNQLTSGISSDLTVGVQGFRDDVQTISATGTNFALPGAPDFDEAADLTAFETATEVFSGGAYIQEEIGLGDRLFLNGGLRIDANSAFGDQVNTELYPKLGAAYLLSDELFFQDLFGSLVNDFKLRAAYGQTGKFPAPFLRDRSFNASQFRGESAPRFNNPGNADLAPEVTSTIEVGFDLALIDNRFGFGLTYFDANTKDALFFVPEQPATGLGTQLRNVGEISNTGIEVEANLLALDTRSARWSFQFGFQTVKNRVTDMGGAAPFNVNGSGGQMRVEEGQPVGAWRVQTPVDTNGDGLLDGVNRQFTCQNGVPDVECVGGQPTPTLSGNISTQVTLWDRLTISARGDWATGHQVMDWGSVWATFNGILRRELVDSTYTYPIRYDTAGNEIGVYGQSSARSEFILDGDWFKFRELGVRYAMPGTMGLDRFMVYGTVRNLAIFSANPMIDPELNGVQQGGGGSNLALGGESSVTLSPPQSFRFGIEVVF